MSDLKKNKLENTEEFATALSAFEKDREYVAAEIHLERKDATGQIAKQFVTIHPNELENSDTADVDNYCGHGVQKSLLRKLKRNNFPILAECDLHGLKFEEALKELNRFLSHISSNKMSCVLIIHGKGLSSPDRKPVLKPLVKRYLLRQPRVLAFIPAPKNRGGDGATLVLLKRSSQL